MEAEEGHQRGERQRRHSGLEERLLRPAVDSS